MSWGFPESVSTFGAEIDGIYRMITYITGFMFVLVEGLLLYCVIRFRHREGRKAISLHGNTRLEIVWTAVTFLGVLFIAGMSMKTWLDIKSADRMPADAYPLAVHAKQFEWNVTYPGPDQRLGTEDDFTLRNQLHVPVGRAVKVMLSADDVIHSFFLPSLRLKQDAVPGMEIPVWFEVTKAGDYVLGCAELCGLGHYRMRGSMTAHTPDDFDAWAATEAAAASGASTPIPPVALGDNR